jgi:hypothetical protein
LKTGESQRRMPPGAVILLVIGACLTVVCTSAAQSNSDTIRGVVINSATHEPVARALVYSPDNRFATMTNSEGRFEFNLPHAEGTAAGDSDPGNSAIARLQARAAIRPNVLIARKPGFMADPNYPAQNLQGENAKDLTITLTPEGLIVGTVTLPSSEAPDPITLQIFRQQVQDGRARWVPAGGTQSTSDGQFRFADLPAGTYKLLTREQLDQDPLSFDPLATDPGALPHKRLFGYPPVYYQNATDFGSAATIQLSAGQTQTVGLTLAKQPYYRVKVPVLPATENALRVEVYSHGRKGPGFSLGYNNNDHAIEGWLPGGTYTIEASTFGANGFSGVESISVRGSTTDGPSLSLVPNASIPVIVKEEFTSEDHTGTMTFNVNGRTTVVKGPRRYLNVTLEPANDVGAGRTIMMRDPTTSKDDAMSIDGAPAGNYWVRVHSSRGYAASVRSGNIDLQHQPLVVGVGGGASPIEITMRDDTAEISGTVAGIAVPPSSADAAGTGSSGGALTVAHIYCVPLPDSAGQFAVFWSNPDGSFTNPTLAPGAYRLLAFDHEPQDLEFRNPQAMQAYDSKGPVVRLLPGQKENVQLQLISNSANAGEQ